MIQLHKLSKRYGEHGVVDAMDLEVQTGELVTLLGPSGCGKTTTLKMINRLIEPTSGTVLINDRDAASIPVVQLRRSIGYVFQRIGLFPHMTVRRNVGIVGELLGWSGERLDKRIHELLEMVELDAAQYLDRLPRELSGGQQQRIGVARALLADPDVLLMDEPFGALDPITRDNLQRQFVALHKKLQASVLFVTHDMTEALLISDRVAVMRQGRISQIGQPGELLRNPANDYVAALMETPKRQADQLESLVNAS